ncbi:MAG: phosphonate ABC transporter, permease protein PhnE [Nitriliruptorales bacterium]
MYAAVVLFLGLTWWAGSDRFGIGFSIPEMVENASRAGRILRDFANPAWGIVRHTVAPFLETLQMAILGAVGGCLVALVVAFLASRVTTPNTATYLADKGVLNVLRAIPDLLYAMVFVATISIGPLAGILALFFFNIGVVAKLLSETVDGIDPGPVEAGHASGATKLQTVRAAVFPQVLPNYLAYSLYTFELNLRASTVLGLVGAGGIGVFIQTQLAAFRYDRLAVVIFEIFLIVFVVESISIALRRRLV